MKQSIKSGALSALISMFPAAFLLALFWRFPIPFSGYETGLNAAFKSIIAVVYYGLMGGFIIVPGLGALSGAAAYRISNDKTKANKLSIRFGCLCALLLGILLSTLDKIIGDW
jgi:hypothetical protein